MEEYNKEESNLQPGTSVFNSGFACIARLNRILDSILQAHMDGDRRGLTIGCRALFRELSSKLSDKEAEIISIKFNKLYKLIEDHKKFYFNARILTASYDETAPKVRALVTTTNSKIWAELESIELSLRKLAERRGLLLPNKTDSTDLFD